jgi:aryl-alcohol dehydrogenase-like predicted oxidoreductase
MAYSPLGVGLLSGAYAPGQTAPAGSLYATGRSQHFAGEMNETAQAVLRILSEIATIHDKTVAQTAINWVLSHPEVTLAITGGDTIAHMDENAGATGWSITPEERARLDETSSGERRILD